MRKSLAYFLIFWMMSLFLSGCSNIEKSSKQFYQQAFTSKVGVPLTGRHASITKTYTQFNTVFIQGPYNVDIFFDSNITTPYLTISGDSGIVDNTHSFVKKDILTIFLDPNLEYSPPVKAKINIYMPKKLAAVNFTGLGQMNIIGMDQKHFRVRISGEVYLFVSGKVTRFDAIATGKSRLNAKCLVSESAFINTANKAQAEVLAGDGISGLAADSSDIYYYDYPQMVGPYQRQSGSMLNMNGVLPASSAKPTT